MELKDLSLFKRMQVGVKALQTALFPSSGSAGGVVRTYTSMADWDRALHGDTGALDYEKEAGSPYASSLVMAAVRWLGNNLPEAPIKVMQGTAKKGDSQPVETHALVDILKRPNPFYSGATLWKAFAASWIISGNVYFLKVRDGRQVKELWYVPHWMLKPAWPEDGSVFVSHYLYEVDGQEFRIDREDIVHFRDGIDPHNLRLGLSPLSALWRELYGDIAAAGYAARIARNFGVPPFILMPKPEQNGVGVDVEKIKEALMRAITGHNTGKPLVMTAPFDIKELSAKPRDMDLRSQHRTPEERVAAVIGLPAMVLGFGAGLERSTYSNVEQAEEHAYESYLLPLHRYLDEELTLQLLPDFDTQQNRFVVHDTSNVRALQEDEDAKHKRVQDDFKTGIIDLAEARSALGYTATPEQQGQFVTRQTAQPPQEPDDDETTKSLPVPSKKDEEAAVAWWERNAPAEAKDLINAEKKANGDSEVIQ